MSERISDERLAELLAEEKEIAESDLVLQLEASWAAEVAQALTELTERRAQDQYLGITEPKSSVKWEYGIARDIVTAKSSRRVAELEIERQRSGPRGYRITGQRLVRRLVSEWEEVTDDE